MEVWSRDPEAGQAKHSTVKGIRTHHQSKISVIRYLALEIVKEY
jgi:hypothetical protein